MVQAVPESCGSVTPYLIVRDANAAIDFYSKAFDAKELFRMKGPDGQSVMHAELMIGDTKVFISGTMPGMEVAWPQGDEWPSVSLHLYVEDADAVFNKAVEAGCKVVMPLEDMFWGDRFGKLADPFNQHWSIATHIEDVTPEEMEKRGAEAFANMDCG